MKPSPAYDPTDARFWDEPDLRAEVERVFRLCADCRLCTKFCGSFPKVFDVIDRELTDAKYGDVDMTRMKPADVDHVVDLCFQCKLCYVKCPYTPGDHEWAIDFPRLMTRAKAQRVRKHGVPRTDRLLGNPDLLGTLGSWGAPVANLLNKVRPVRELMAETLGIHPDKTLPPFAWTTFSDRFRALHRKPAGEPAAKVAFFATCFVEYNAPEIGVDTMAVMAKNRVDVELCYPRCCGMPALHNGDMDGAIEAARVNVTGLLPHVQHGRTVIATNPTCSQMLRVEYPRLLGTAESRLVAAATSDPTEFLARLAEQGKLNREFKTGAGKLAWHVPCHLRAQSVGYKTRDVLSLLPDTEVEMIEACSGHDGTWAMKQENFTDSLKWGRKAFDGIQQSGADCSCSDCPLAAVQIEQGAGRHPLNPMQILARSYRGETIKGADLV